MVYLFSWSEILTYSPFPPGGVLSLERDRFADCTVGNCFMTCVIILYAICSINAEGVSISFYTASYTK